MTRLSVVIPAFNEAQRLPPSMERIADHLARTTHWLPAQLVVVDDGSADHTAAVAEQVHLPAGVGLDITKHIANRGKGAAVRTGFGKSTGETVLLSDADLATPIDELERLAVVTDGNTLAIGSRAADRSLIAIRQPRYRDLMGRTFNMLVQRLALPGVRDTQCGFKLLPGQLARALSTVQKIDGFAFDVELLVVAKAWGYRIEEVAVHWQHVESSRVQPVLHSAEMLRDLLRLWLRRISGGLPEPPSGLEKP